MNGDPLPLEHGFPVRMVVPGLYGYVSATKWLTRAEGHDVRRRRGVLDAARLQREGADQVLLAAGHPPTGEAVAAGRMPVAGVAWAQTVGIDRVEVNIDDGDWQSATLSSARQRRHLGAVVRGLGRHRRHPLRRRARGEQERRRADRRARADRPRRLVRMAAHPGQVN